MHYLVKQNNAKIWLNTVAVNLYFSETVKCSNKGVIVSRNCANNSNVYSLYFKRAHVVHPPDSS